MMKNKISNFQDVQQFERILVDFWMKKLVSAMPVMIEDSRSTDSVEDAEKELQLSIEADKSRLGFDFTNNDEVIEQYKQGKITDVVFNLPPLIFNQSKKSPISVQYLKVQVSSHVSKEHDLEHFILEKTR